MTCRLQTCPVTDLLRYEAHATALWHFGRSLSRRAHYHLPAADVLETLLGSHCKP